jgi:DNA-directed RNA polymerase subunit F
VPFPRWPIASASPINAWVKKASEIKKACTLEHLREVTTVDPSATDRAADKMLDLTRIANKLADVSAPINTDHGLVILPA